MVEPPAVLRGVLQFLVHRDLRAVVHLAGGLPDPPADDRTRQEHACRAGSGPPRNLSRLPKYATAEVVGTQESVAAGISERLKGWRRVTRHTDEGTEISAEKGYLREFGNIVFHFSLLGLLVAIAVGKLFGYEATSSSSPTVAPVSARPRRRRSTRSGPVTASTARRCTDVPASQRLPSPLPANGQALSFASNIDYQAGDDLAAGTWRPYRLEVNHPLRIGGDRVYLQGHATPRPSPSPSRTQKRTQTLQWRPDDQHTLLSSGGDPRRPARRHVPRPPLGAA